MNFLMIELYQEERKTEEEIAAECRDGFSENGN